MRNSDRKKYEYMARKVDRCKLLIHYLPIGHKIQMTPKREKKFDYEKGKITMILDHRITYGMILKFIALNFDFFSLSLCRQKDNFGHCESTNVYWVIYVIVYS